MKPHLKNIIINLQNSDAWKIQLTIATNFISSKDAEEDRVMHSNSDNIVMQMMLLINLLSHFVQYIKKI